MQNLMPPPGFRTRSTGEAASDRLTRMKFLSNRLVSVLRSTSSSSRFIPYNGPNGGGTSFPLSSVFSLIRWSVLGRFGDSLSANR